MHRFAVSNWLAENVAILNNIESRGYVFSLFGTKGAIEESGVVSLCR
jgi:hypothetical protein